MNKLGVLALLGTLLANFQVRADDAQLGKLGFYRTCYDVKHYEIRVNVHPISKSIDGSNTISTQLQAVTSMLQIDYVPSMFIDDILLNDGQKLKFARKKRAVLIQLPKVYEKGEYIKFTVKFHGKPEVAKKAPWQGGFVWSKDNEGNDWVGLACESKGASIWLPCKDHWSDEPDSLDMYLGVPRGLTGVSNGKFISTKYIDSFVTFHWKTSNTINHYNISINIGMYAHITDKFNGEAGLLKKDYYILKYNSQKAIRHFKGVDTMLRAFEHFFGPYPFYEDTYKLVETPYWGMEHQSCVAYGNNYRYNDYGFDFIIVHESGHEWFANSITADDPADMWIHESFTTYSEALYLEYSRNYDYAVSYLKMQRKNIVSKKPIQGTRNIDYHDRPDNDIYYKGSWMLHTLRNHLQNDSLWFVTLRNFSNRFRHCITNTTSVARYFENSLGMDSGSVFFKQYIYGKSIPTLKVCKVDSKDGKYYVECRFTDVVKGFSLNLKLGDKFEGKVGDKAVRFEISSDFDINALKSLEDSYLIKVSIK